MMALLQLAQSLSDAGLSSALIRFRDVTDDETSSLYWLNVLVASGTGLVCPAASSIGVVAGACAGVAVGLYVRSALAESHVGVAFTGTTVQAQIRF